MLSSKRKGINEVRIPGNVAILSKVDKKLEINFTLTSRWIYLSISHRDPRVNELCVCEWKLINIKFKKINSHVDVESYFKWRALRENLLKPSR